MRLLSRDEMGGSGRLAELKAEYGPKRDRAEQPALRLRGQRLSLAASGGLPAIPTHTQVYG